MPVARRRTRHVGDRTTIVSDGYFDFFDSAPKYFTVGAISPGSTSSLEDSWTLTLTRVGASSGYGAYTVVFTNDGYDSTNSTINAIPDINPLGT